MHLSMAWQLLSLPMASLFEFLEEKLNNKQQLAMIFFMVLKF
jgi:hypothetical protein